jgi:N-glycosidase YbiA
MDTRLYANDTDSFTVTYVAESLPFSNWSAHKIKIWGKTFPTIEHAYQYKKFADTDQKFADRIRRCKSPWEAKQLAMSRPIDTKIWDKNREKVMFELLKAKVYQHKDVMQALLETGSLAIIQKGPPEDDFWCVGWSSKGRNVLGKLWMKIRDGLQEEIK